MFGKKNLNLVGLDIGSHAIKVVELKQKGKRGEDEFELQSLGYEPLPHDAIVEGTIIDSSAVAEAIRMTFEENKISNKNVIVSVSGNSVIIKKISLPSMETEELAESIIWEAKHNIPYPYEETSVDYAILKPVDSSTDKNLDILLVAAKKDKISNLSNVVSQAKKNLMAIDVDSFALQNSYEINYPEMFHDKTISIINIGANITNLLIVEKGRPQLFRDLTVGGAFFAENISKELGISFDDSEKLIKGIPIENIEQEQTQDIINMNIMSLIDEIEKTFSFYEAGEMGERKIEKIFLAGGLSKLKDVKDLIEEKSQITTEIFNPFRKISFDENKFDSIYVEDMASMFGVVTGLAFRTLEK